MSLEHDWLIENANLVTFKQGEPGYGMVKKARVAIREGQISLIDTQAKTQIKAKQVMDAYGRWLTPGLIDCHTHLVFGGNRAEEFEWRLQGESYQAIAQRGGGILSTVNQTRALSAKQLYAQSLPRLKRLLEEGVTTIEIKSGYGLNTSTEIKMLEVAQELGQTNPVTVKKTFLGAHAVPPEFKHFKQPSQAYINYVCDEMMPAANNKNLIDAVDVFCEGIGFSNSECEQVYLKAKSLGLPIKGHVEQLSNLRGAVLAAKHGALSVDHIEYLTEDDVSALKHSVAVLLPAAFYCLNETQKPPIDALRKKGIPTAVATDLNPGTAPMASLLTAMNQACVLFGLTPEESLRGVTASAAQALGLSNKGRIEIGLDADLVLWNIEHPAELAYGINFHRPDAVWQNGQQVKR